MAKLCACGCGNIVKPNRTWLPGHHSRKPVVDEKPCTDCGIVKPIDEFHKSKRRTSGYHSRCGKCQSLRLRANNFGITVKKLIAFYSKQDGRCKICKLKLLVEELCIDHDHKCCPRRAKSCGKCIRGLLCTQCNFMIGHGDNDPEILEAGAQYLREWNALQREWDSRNNTQHDKNYASLSQNGNVQIA
ncbi:MAG: endonuclease domain-containing protein [Nitrospira sp.]